MATSPNASCPVSGPIYQEDLEIANLGSFAWSTYNGILHASTTSNIEDANDWIPE
jgi:hypothetical protein